MSTQVQSYSSSSMKEPRLYDPEPGISNTLWESRKVKIKAAAAFTIGLACGVMALPVASPFIGYGIIAVCSSLSVYIASSGDKKQYLEPDQIRFIMKDDFWTKDVSGQKHHLSYEQARKISATGDEAYRTDSVFSGTKRHINRLMAGDIDADIKGPMIDRVYSTNNKGRTTAVIFLGSIYALGLR